MILIQWVDVKRKTVLCLNRNWFKQNVTKGIRKLRAIDQTVIDNCVINKKYAYLWEMAIPPNGICR